MRIEVVCPACASGYLLDESSAGKAFVCPSCSTASTVDVVGASVSGSGVRRAAVAAVAASPRTEIVCPRCDLHFSPEQHRFKVLPGTRRNILIVEEEGYSRDATAEALSKDYDVVTAGTVDAAARILALGGIDLMVLDTDIDQGVGRQLLRHGAHKSCPIVIYGHDESESFGEAWEASRNQGADDMVIKGMNAAETLVRKVGALLGRPVDDEDSI